MVSRRETQVSEAVAHLAGEFLARASNVPYLLTVTHADLSPDFKNATIYISVLPQTHENEALAAAKRSRSDLRAFIRAKSKLHPTPVVDFAIDFGEKNRQRIEELTRK